MRRKREITVDKPEQQIDLKAENNGRTSAQKEQRKRVYLGVAMDCEVGLRQRPEKSIENRGTQQISGCAKAQGSKSLAVTLQCAQGIQHRAWI
jgi:hypothetical protein